MPGALDIPTEILLNILEVGCRDLFIELKRLGKTDHNTDRHSPTIEPKDFVKPVALVCRQWYQFIMASPSLWIMDVYYPMSFLPHKEINLANLRQEAQVHKLRIEQAHGVDLDIIMVLSELRWSNPTASRELSQIVEDMIHFLFGHSNRWRSLTYDIRPPVWSLAHFVPLLMKEANLNYPRLLELYILSGFFDLKSPDEPCLPVRAPNLAILRGVDTIWPFFPSVLTLSFPMFWSGNAKRWKTTLQSSSPYLQHLSLGESFTNKVNFVDEGIQVDFPALTTFIVETNAPPILADILQHLVMPKLEDLKITFTASDSPEILDVRCSIILESVRFLSIFCANTSQFIHVHKMIRTSNLLELRLNFFTTLRATHYGLSIHYSNLKHLSVRVDDFPIRLALFLSIFTVPSLTHLNLIFEDEMGNNVDRTRLTYPALQSLRLAGDVRFLRLLDVPSITELDLTAHIGLPRTLEQWEEACGQDKISLFGKVCHLRVRHAHGRDFLGGSKVFSSLHTLVCDLYPLNTSSPNWLPITLEAIGVVESGQKSWFSKLRRKLSHNMLKCNADAPVTHLHLHGPPSGWCDCEDHASLVRFIANYVYRRIEKECPLQTLCIPYLPGTEVVWFKENVPQFHWNRHCPLLHNIGKDSFVNEPVLLV